MKRVLLDHKKQIAEIVILGDFLDMYWVSKHPKDPRVNSTLQDELEAGNKELDWFDEHFPRVKKIYLEGNHEARLESYLADKAPALFGLTELKYLLRLNARPNWTWIKYGPKQAHRVLGSNLIARHTPPGCQPKQCVQKAGCSLVYGHIHRSELAFAAGLLGHTHQAFSPGWLGDHRHDEVFGYVRDFHQWQLGFAFVFQNQNTSHFFSQLIHINDDITTQVGLKFYAK